MYRTVVFQKDVDQELCADSAVELTHVAGSWTQLCSCCSQTGHQSLWLTVWQNIEIWILPIVPPHRQETSSAVSEHTTVCPYLSVWSFLSILTQSWSLQRWKNTSFKLLKLVFTLHFASQSFFLVFWCAWASIGDFTTPPGFSWEKPDGLIQLCFSEMGSYRTGGRNQNGGTVGVV